MEEKDERIADALERIADSLEDISNKLAPNYSDAITILEMLGSIRNELNDYFDRH